MLNIKLNQMVRNAALLLKLGVAMLLIFSPSALACHWYDVPCNAREAAERAKDVARGVERGVIAIASLTDLVRGESRTHVRDVHIAAPLVEGGSDWMSALSDDIPLSKLTIPGTHDSGTGALHLMGTPTVLPWTKLCVTLVGDTFCLDEDKIKAIAGSNVPGALVETQYWSIGEQLRNGIRFLDIRIDGSGPYILHHGPAPVGDFHQHVLKAVGDFLLQHPGEVVLMSIKEENAGTLNKAKFVSEVIRGNTDSVIFVTEVPAGSTARTLAETRLKDVRGKVVLFNRLGNEDSSLAGKRVGGVAWGDVKSQDQYENDWGCHFENTSSYPWTKGGCDSGRADKTKAIGGFFDTLDSSGTKFNVNFASAQMNLKGKPTAMDIVGNAGTQNAALLAYFKTRGFRKDAGQIIVMDYPAYMDGKSEPNELLKLIVSRGNQGK